MYKTLKFLTHNEVEDYIKNSFETIGLGVEFQEFTIDGNIYKNVIATINPQYNQRVVVSCHYDVCGDKQGADDNTSVIAGIIESAKQLYEYKEQLKFRVDFVAFTLEEPAYIKQTDKEIDSYNIVLSNELSDTIEIIDFKKMQYSVDRVVKSVLNLNNIVIDMILKLCAIKWIKYCGISASCRTIYWDIAINLCKDSNVFEKYILSYEDGEESLKYDISSENSFEFYEDIKDYELKQLSSEEKTIFLQGYNIFKADVKFLR